MIDVFLIGAALATALALLACHELPPFSSRTIQVNEAVVLPLLLLLARWGALAFALSAAAPGEGAPLGRLGAPVRVLVVLALHTLLGLLSLTCCFAWLGSLNDNPRWLNIAYVTVVFGIAVPVAILPAMWTHPAFERMIGRRALLAGAGGLTAALAALGLFLLVRAYRKSA
jgi:hypothetical protein